MRSGTMSSFSCLSFFRKAAIGAAKWKQLISWNYCLYEKIITILRLLVKAIWLTLRHFTRYNNKILKIPGFKMQINFSASPKLKILFFNFRERQQKKRLVFPTIIYCENISFVYSADSRFHWSLSHQAKQVLHFNMTNLITFLVYFITNSVIFNMTRGNWHTLQMHLQDFKLKC